MASRLNLHKVWLFAFEAALGYLLFMPFYNGGPFAFLLPFLFLSIALYGGIHLLFYRFKIRSLAAFFAVAVIVGAVSFLTVLPLFYALLISLYWFWRTLRLLEPYEHDELVKLFVGTVALSIFYQFFLQLFLSEGNTPTRAIFLPVLFQLFCLFMLSRRHEGAQGKGEARSNTAMSSVLLVAGAVVTFVIYLLFPLFQKVLSLIIGGFAYVVIKLAAPVMQWLMPSGNEDVEKYLDEQNTANDDRLKRLADQYDGSSGIDLIWIITSIAVIIILVVFIVLWRKKVQVNPFNQTKTLAETSSLASHKVARYQSTNKKAPKQRIRREMYGLQKKLKKLGYGRLWHESVLDWLNRLPVQADEGQNILNIYERVRYGGETESDSEAETFRQAARHMVSRLKAARKEEQDDNK